MTTIHKPAVIEWTDDALMALDHVGKVELIDGVLHKMAPAGLEHDDVGLILGAALLAAVRPARLGRVYGSSAGYRLSVNTLLSPDVSFISMPRLKGLRAQYHTFATFAPDLAVEILSPGDARKAALRKLPDYFAHGTRLAWIINPKKKTVEVFTSPNAPAHTLALPDTLTADPVIPDFRLPLAELFDAPDFD